VSPAASSSRISAIPEPARCPYAADLDVHAIVDNYSAHKHPAIERWLQRHPRFHLHFVPTSASWLNLVEVWFSHLTKEQLRRGDFLGVRDLISVPASHQIAVLKSANSRIFT
jgi:hypothetical protein